MELTIFTMASEITLGLEEAFPLAASAVPFAIFFHHIFIGTIFLVAFQIDLKGQLQIQWQ